MADGWFTAEGWHEGLPVLYRGRHFDVTTIASSTFSRLLIVERFFDTADSIGLPSELQYKAIADWEEAIIDVIEQNRQGLLAFVQTFNGRIRYFIYIAEDANSNDLIPVPEIPGFTVRSSVEDDPDWLEYQRFKAGLIDG